MNHGGNASDTEDDEVDDEIKCQRDRGESPSSLTVEEIDENDPSYFAPGITYHPTSIEEAHSDDMMSDRCSAIESDDDTAADSDIDIARRLSQLNPDDGAAEQPASLRRTADEPWRGTKRRRRRSTGGRSSTSESPQCRNSSTSPATAAKRRKGP
ncbi:hypothetical protein ANO11243_035710 [Dothideomycetidae sp. 11243]|nr:hypothetical protein ANO11243_035710 [fungal sp. No.11243]